ncbi:uridylate kinase PUMPKIN, chloroplastic [Diospyros lotus]|uniref:uridylate kinase PUMPKIN, chloroplastic n=1 Tax=Diospyros lotus TaxID=55363 RepID=UPI00225A34B8|nr:uridylate kinase PUMPKIN, chloroplastic [Diospyros lotus]
MVASERQGKLCNDGDRESSANDDNGDRGSSTAMAMGKLVYSDPRATSLRRRAAESPNEAAGEGVRGDNYGEGAFCSQPDPKCATSYHDVNPFAENDSNPFDDGPDPTKSRANLSNEKRRDREELSDGGTPYSYNKKPKFAGGGGGGASSASGGGEYRKDREEWSDTAIACLLDAYTEKFTQLNRGNLRGRDWEEVAAIVSERCEKQTKSVEQCKNKVDNLKKRYKLERHRMNNGGVSASHWPWFKKMEVIVGNSLPSKAVPDDDKAVAGSSNSLRQSKRYGIATPSPSAQITNMKSKSLTNPRWRRVVFKISGAALAGSGPHNIDPKVAMLIAREVSTACRLGVEVAIVVGGRNFFCGDTWVTATGLDRCTAYQIGMMATVMNSILLQSALEKMGIQTRVQTAFAMPEVGEPYSRQRAIRHLEKGRVVIFGGIGAGTGNPLFSTDTAAALRASEIHADAVLKGTNVDGIYLCDSRSNNVIFEHISFRELASRGTSPMDTMAVSFCEENGIPVLVFNLHEPGNISRALCGEQVGTLIDQTGRVS